MLKRVRKEVSQSTLISFDEADETIICVSGISTRIKISSSYPFSAPKLINCSWKLRSENDPIVWVAVLLRREKNRLFFSDPSQCLCCTSPSCAWSPNRRLEEVAHYAVCLSDVEAAQSHRRMYNQVFAPLNIDILRVIADSAWYVLPRAARDAQCDESDSKTW